MFQQSEKSHMKVPLSSCPAGQTGRTEESTKDILLFIVTPSPFNNQQPKSAHPFLRLPAISLVTQHNSEVESDKWLSCTVPTRRARPGMGLGFTLGRKVE